MYSEHPLPRFQQTAASARWGIEATDGKQPPDTPEPKLPVGSPDR
jgi:hypothetical protein